MFRHADVVCLCLVGIMWQFSMLPGLQFVNTGRGAIGDHMEETYSRAGLITVL